DSAARAAMATVNLGVALGELGRNEQELDSYRRVIDRWGDAQEEELQVQLALALFNRGVVFEQLARTDEALADYEEIIKRFVGSRELLLERQVAVPILHNARVVGPR